MNWNKYYKRVSNNNIENQVNILIKKHSIIQMSNRAIKNSGYEEPQLDDEWETARNRKKRET